MQSLPKVFRHFFFSTFIICNAIIASASVWNFSISKAIQQELRIDTYLTFVGVFGLLFISLIIVLELLRKDSITGRVWFECSWVGIFWMLELAAASALSAVGPRVMCSREAVNAIPEGCSSTRTVLAFSWICTIILMSYFLFLVVTTATHQLQERDSSIWQRGVREFPCPDTQSTLKRTSRTTVLDNSGTQASAIMAPQPRQAAPAELYGYRGPTAQHEIEYYRPPTAFSPPALPEPAIPGHRQKMSMKQMPASVYPKAVQSSIAAQSIPAQLPDSRQRPPSPSPLGDWPRANIMSQPSRSRSTKARPPPLMRQPSVGAFSPSSSSLP
jgi:hypothetical protein